jgi:hypothetical protein
MDAVINFTLGQGVPIDEGILILIGFAATGFAVAWHNGRRIPLGFIVQYVYATLLLRYLASFLIFHHTMLEGLWVFAWASAGLVGIRLARPRRAK